MKRMHSSVLTVIVVLAALVLAGRLAPAQQAAPPKADADPRMVELLEKLIAIHHARIVNAEKHFEAGQSPATEVIAAMRQFSNAHVRLALLQGKPDEAVGRLREQLKRNQLAETRMKRLADSGRVDPSALSDVSIESIEIELRLLEIERANRPAAPK